MAENSSFTGNLYALPPGFNLYNRDTGRAYQISRMLGQGGFGITYAGISLSDGSAVAIKEFFPSKISSRRPDNSITVIGEQASFQNMLNSFYKEAKVLYGLQGLDSVVKIYDYFYANNTAYYVMEYVSGISLQQMLQRTGPISISAYGPQFRQLMHDIAQLHRQGVIHRDISPDNIMVSPSGRFKLVDFGSARAYNSTMLTVNLKRDFAPLEQYSSKGQGAYTDVYSLAATMYYCFTGKLIPGAMDREHRDTLAPPSVYGIQISSRQERALMKALAVMPNKRYQSMEEFEAAFFDGGTASSSDSGSPELQALFSGLTERLERSLNIIKGDVITPLLCGIFLLGAILVEILL